MVWKVFCILDSIIFVFVIVVLCKARSQRGLNWGTRFISFVGEIKSPNKHFTFCYFSIDNYFINGYTVLILVLSSVSSIFLFVIYFLIWSTLVRRNLFWPPSLVYISVILTHILHITNHAGPSVWAATHVLHSGHFFSWDIEG